MDKEQKKKILIVDDDSFLLDMYSLRFSQADFDVETAMNADEVLQKLRAGLVPDVCLFDVVMPGKDGFEMLESINQENLIPKTIKIYLSNLGQEQDIARGKSLGAASYIVKANSTPSEVVEHVNKVLKEHGI
ncbi:MAG TPA: response regulator [Candidatus Paceibacterota bacterium]|jgi:CheY-like chemotaxis protein|nr:response regulator [Candidatus Paceibacterota bacterium]